MRKGLEPSTSGVTGRHSNQLNYRTRLAAFSKGGCKYRHNLQIYKRGGEIFLKFFAPRHDTSGLLPEMKGNLTRKTPQTAGKAAMMAANADGSHPNLHTTQFISKFARLRTVALAARPLC